MQKVRIFVAVIGILWLGSTLSDAWGETPSNAPKTPLPPGIAIHTEASPKVASIGDRIQIDVDITMPDGYRAVVPRPAAPTGDFTILHFFPGPAVPEVKKSPSNPGSAEKNAGTIVHHRARILVAVYKTGKYIFPSIPIILKADDGKEMDVATSPVTIDIRSVLTAKDQALRDLKKQADIPEPFRWLLWIGIALACIILGVIAWLLWRRFRKRPVTFSPEEIRNLLEIAEADLRVLLARGLPDSGMEKEFYVLLADIVKRILEPGYEIQTAERTTSEIVESLKNTPAVEDKKVDRIESFLLRCDIVKFAKYVPVKSEQEAAAQDALQILAEAKSTVAARQLPVEGSQPTATHSVSSPE